MTKEEIIAGNRLIAEFIRDKTESMQLSDIYYFPQFGHHEVRYGLAEYEECFRSDELKFHSSWDWLMPVVEKCFQSYDSVEDNSSNHQFKLNDALIEINIESLWKSVIEFITWYNQNK